MRADATRNRAKILDAARTLIARHGAAAGMDEIAGHAGVAVGTLYRHFPTKDDLLQAIAQELADRILTLLADTVTAVEAGRPAATEVGLLISRAAGILGTDRGLKAVLTDLGTGRLQQQTTEQALAALTRLVSLGHADGTLRADLHVEDLLLILSTIPSDELPPGAQQRWLTLMSRTFTA